MAVHTPEKYDDIITPNGDGTDTVRFTYDSRGAILSDYVTVDSMFPANQDGHFAYAGSDFAVDSPSAILWPALMEKAYAQWAETGNNASAYRDENAFRMISGGHSHIPLNQLLGTTEYVASDVTRRSPSYRQIIASFANGPNVVFGSYKNPGAKEVVGGHAYTMVDFDDAKKTITYYNPWGPDGVTTENGTFYPGIFKLNLAWTRQGFDGYYHVGAVRT